MARMAGMKKEVTAERDEHAEEGEEGMTTMRTIEMMGMKEGDAG
jgi:hypothetical protein